MNEYTDLIRMLNALADTYPKNRVCREAADVIAALHDMLNDARMEMAMVREALCVEYEPHQSLMERTMDAIRALSAAPAQEKMIEDELTKLAERFAETGWHEGKPVWFKFYADKFFAFARAVRGEREEG